MLNEWKLEKKNFECKVFQLIQNMIQITTLQVSSPMLPEQQEEHLPLWNEDAMVMQVYGFIYWQSLWVVIEINFSPAKATGIAWNNEGKRMLIL